jgi:beta-galactosidase
VIEQKFNLSSKNMDFNMKVAPHFNYLYLIIFLVTSGFASRSFATQKINYNDGWEFYKSKHDLRRSQMDDENWEKVVLPHTPRLEPKVVNNQWQGISWYEKQINFLPEWQDKKVFIEFEAAMRTADVWINGRHIFHHIGGYLPFTIDLSGELHFDKPNTIRVKLNNYDNPISGPKPLEQLDFNTYGGLYRNVNLIIKPHLHITDPISANEVGSGGLAVEYVNVSKASAHIRIRTHVKNDTAGSAVFTIQQVLKYEDDEVAVSSNSYSLDPGAAQQFSQNIEISAPALWHPHHPHLYSLTTQVMINDQAIDFVENNIGIRSIAFNKDNQLLINGEKIFLRGINRHQEYPYVGYALSDQAQYRDAVKIKSAGFDYVRVAHYPMSSAFMRAADELGLMVLNAIPGWQYSSKSEQFTEQIIQTCRDMIRRDRNHASVLAWECSLNETFMNDDMVSQLHQVVKSEIPKGYSAGWVPGYDIYMQARQHRLKHYEPPTQPYIVSEYGDWEYYAENAGLAQDQWAGLKQEERTSRQLLSDGQVRLLQQVRNIQEAHNDNFRTPAFADGYWVMFDYNRGYAKDLEASGIMSIDRLPKYSYYFFQSQRPANISSPLYQSGPMVNIASDWTEGSPLNITVFSNAERVELSLNGKLVPYKTPKKRDTIDNINSPPFVFEVPKFVPGTLLAKAYIDGSVVAEHEVVTATEPRYIELDIDTSGVELQEGIRDVIFVYARMTDSDGNLTTLNFEEIQFKITGNIELLNQGAISTEKGIAAALVRVGPGLSGASIQALSAKYKISSNVLKLFPKSTSH